MSHPIALSGSEVAQRYFVKAHPASYWIDREGRVVDYDIGFLPGGEEKLERKLRALLDSK